MTIVVTGASGKTGRAVVQDLMAAGRNVRAVDRAGGTGDRGELAEIGAPLRADLEDFGDTVDALLGAEAVIHLAAIPAPGFFTDARTLATNNTINGNVFLAAAKAGVRRVVWTSSETALGLPFTPTSPPRHLPWTRPTIPSPPAPTPSRR